MIRRKPQINPEEQSYGNYNTIPWWVAPAKWIGEKLGVPTLIICIFSVFAWYGCSWIGNELVKPFFVTLSNRHMEYLDTSEKNTELMVRLLQTQESTLKEIQKELSTTNRQHETMISQQQDILDELKAGH